ncbi:MAG TPA: ribonuclease P protein component [Gemmatimonadota bacterium]|nr:ribonuclease P protein component [Gemmatimonadota bacterium]
MGQLPRDRRITRNKEIAALLAGRRARGPALDLYWCPAAGRVSRAACTTPKFGRTNVRRNLLRRRLKSLTGEILLASGAPFDYLVRARPPAYEMDFAGLRAALGELAERVEAPPDTATPEAS